MRNYKYYITKFIIALVVTTLYGNWTVAPMSLSYYLEQNNTGTDALWIKNPTDDTLEVKITLQDYIKVNGQDQMRAARTTDRSCAGWLFIHPEEVKILPYQNKDIRIDMTVPKDAYGDYWTMLFVEEVSKPKSNKVQYGKMTLDIKTLLRWGVRIKQHVPGSFNRSGKVTSILFMEEDASRKVELKFLNNSMLIHSRCTGWIEIRDEDGETISKFDIKEFSIYPNDERIFTIEILDELNEGEFSAVGIIDYGGDHLVGGEILFTIEK